MFYLNLKISTRVNVRRQNFMKWNDSFTVNVFFSQSGVFPAWGSLSLPNSSAISFSYHLMLSFAQTQHCFLQNCIHNAAFPSLLSNCHSEVSTFVAPLVEEDIKLKIFDPSINRCKIQKKTRFNAFLSTLKLSNFLNNYSIPFLFLCFAFIY